MAGIQMSSCQWHLFQLPLLVSGFGWASTDVPWGDLDNNRIEASSDHGEWVGSRSSLVACVPANATLRDMKKRIQ